MNGGTLLAQTTSESATGPGAVTVNNAGSVLGGNGLVDGAVMVNQAALRGGDGTAAEGALTLRGSVSMSDGSIIELALGASGTHSSLTRSGSNVWSFDVDQAVRFISFGAEPGTYDNLITGLAGNPVDPSQWTITNAGWMGTFTFDGANIDLELTAVPEPSGWIGAVLAASLLVWTRLRESNPKGNSHLGRGRE